MVGVLIRTQSHESVILRMMVMMIKYRVSEPQATVHGKIVIYHNNIIIIIIHDIHESHKKAKTTMYTCTKFIIIITHNHNN